VVLLGGGLLVDQASRLLGGRDVEVAFEHAGSLLHAERALGLPSEQALQDLLLDAEPPVRAANGYHAAAHLPVTALALLWLLAVHPAVDTRAPLRPAQVGRARGHAPGDDLRRQRAGGARRLSSPAGPWAVPDACPRPP